MSGKDEIMKKIRRLLIFCLMISMCVQTINVHAAYKTAPGGITYNGMYIPVYDGDGYEEIHGNEPEFTAAERTTTAFEQYSNLDSLGRCGVAYANVCEETMPADDEERGTIGTIYPTGWMQNKYDTSLVSGSYIYNRCHLIGWQLTAENANAKNLITGTRYFNDPVMLKFENQVATYVKKTDHHVIYRVTPVFDGNNLLADGVIMEAESVEDNEIDFCVFCYNVQKGIEIDYSNGANRLVTDSSSKTDISNCKISISPTKYVYTGSALKPNVQITNNGSLLTTADYSVTYKDNINAGTASVVITGKGNYTGTVTKEFTIYPRYITAAKVTVSDMIYTGKAVEPSVKVTYNNMVLTSGKDYKVSYSDHTDIGSGKVTVTGIGNYSESKTVTFWISPAKGKISKVKAGSKKLTVSWSKVKGAKGYLLQYRAGNGSYKTIKISSGNTVKKTIANLKKNTTYQVRIRAYAAAGSKTVYGAYSNVVKNKSK